MNYAYYGHANNLIFTFTKDGKFNKYAMPNGMLSIYNSVCASKDGPDVAVGLHMSESGVVENDYRKDYYGLRQLKSADETAYYNISRQLGYEDGKSSDNIFSIMPEEGVPIDVLFVWDEGYGGLSVPNCKNVLWASDKALPDPEQFNKIADKCFLLLDGNALRKAGAFISRQISWERTASELIAEIQSNPAINYLLNARQLLITFGLDGAVLILPKNTTGEFEASLILTHGDVEGAISSKRPGSAAEVYVFTFLTAILALITVRASSFVAAHGGGAENIFSAVIDLLIKVLTKTGLRLNSAAENTQSEAEKWGGALRAILESAESIFLLCYFSEHNEQTTESDEATHYSQPTLKDWPAFSIPLEKNEALLAVPEDWTIINSVENRQIYDVAFDYVHRGASAIEGLPCFSLGALTTVDRWEIESYQNIRNLILDYANTDSVRPLSVAVFGSPGSGKSFGVTQIAMNILPGKIEKLEFNVSQFFGPQSLSVAFQKVRDAVLEGKLPLVFFDEFDSDKDGIKLGWIKSFLMPMQDGRFSDENGDHPLGKCILVFAGGTTPNFESFAAPLTSDEHEIFQAFKDVKGPDFISRLKGTINVLGPNPKDKNDQNHVLRRSLLLRSLCERKLTVKGNTVPVSPGIIRAMLTVPQFRHGARSMEAIIDMSRIENGFWEPAALPFRSQLALHVDANAFMKLAANSDNL
jgi:hypothetical protein